MYSYLGDSHRLFQDGPIHQRALSVMACLAAFLFAFSPAGQILNVLPKTAAVIGGTYNASFWLALV